MCSQQTLAEDQQSERQLWSQGETAGLWAGTHNLSTQGGSVWTFSAVPQQPEQCLEHGALHQYLLNKQRRDALRPGEAMGDQRWLLKGAGA